MTTKDTPSPGAAVERRLAEFLQTCMSAAWQGHDMEGSDLQDLAQECGLLKVVPFDPEKHDDSECLYTVEPGSDWFELTDDVEVLLRDPTPAAQGAVAYSRIEAALYWLEEQDDEEAKEAFRVLCDLRDERDGLLKAASAAQGAVAEGWPTDAMVEAAKREARDQISEFPSGGTVWLEGYFDIAAILKAALAAAPQPPVAGGADEWHCQKCTFVAETRREKMAHQAGHNNALAPATERNAVIEECAKLLDNQYRGGHCGEGTGEIIVRQRRNGIFEEAAELVRALKTTPPPHDKEATP